MDIIIWIIIAVGIIIPLYEVIFHRLPKNCLTRKDRIISWVIAFTVYAVFVLILLLIWG